MKIAMVVDRKGSALDRIAEMMKNELPHLDIDICDVHPKRPTQDQLNRFESAYKDCDVVDFRYWKTAEMIKNEFEITKPQILTHYNPYDLKESDWKDYINFAANLEIHKNLGDMKVPNKWMPIPVDLSKWEYGDYDENSRIVLMVAARIEKTKGIKEVAQACKELDLDFHLVGTISKPAYFEEVKRIGFTFHEQISDEELAVLYSHAALHVCNSEDGFESGTMPILESMASGLPVLTRNIGHVPDFYNGHNVRVRAGAKEDVEDLKNELNQLMESAEERKSLREHAIKSVRNYSSKRVAWSYERIYYNLISNKELVSVIVPTCDRPEIITTTVDKIQNSDYENIEIIVVNDGDEFVPDMTGKYAVKVYETPNKFGYNLGQARNIGAIAATGEILVFVDDRMGIDTHTISAFAENIKEKSFLWGVKDGVRKGFVENLSCIKRQDFIDAGMMHNGFPYGFMSQEIRERFKKQGFTFKRIDNATGSPITGSKNSRRKIKDINKSKDLLWKMGYGG